MLGVLGSSLLLSTWGRGQVWGLVGWWVVGCVGWWVGGLPLAGPSLLLSLAFINACEGALGGYPFERKFLSPGALFLVLEAYLPTCLTLCLPTYLPTYLPADLPTYRPTHRLADRPTYHPTYLPTYAPIQQPT